MTKIFKVSLVLLIAVFSSKAFATEFVVITNEANGAEALSKDEISQMLLVNITNWKDGKKVVLVNFAPGTDEGEEIYKSYMGMTGVQAKKHYLTKVFNGVLSAAPASAESADEVVEMVAKTPGAIGFVPKGTHLAKVKTLAVK